MAVIKYSREYKKPPRSNDPGSRVGLVKARQYKAIMEEVDAQILQILKMVSNPNGTIAVAKMTTRMNETATAGIPQAQIAKMMEMGTKKIIRTMISLDFNQSNMRLLLLGYRE